MPNNYIKSWGKKSGIARTGKIVRVNGAKARVSGIRFSYQWYVGGKAVQGAAGKRSHLKINRSMRGRSVQLKITAQKKLFRPKVKTVKFGTAR